MRLAIVGKTTLKRGNKKPPLSSMNFFLLERGTRNLTKCGLGLSQFPPTTACQINITVQDIQDTFGYAIHEIRLTIRNNVSTQSRFGRL